MKHTSVEAGRAPVRMGRPSTIRHPPSIAGAGGSAYLISLLVMLVLTLMGLALSTLTQTELLIGSNERQIQRLFFAADAGRAASTAKALTANDYRPYEFELTEADLWGTSGLTTRHVVNMSPFYPAQEEICDLCDSANEMSLKEDPLYRTAFIVGSTAIRINDVDNSEIGRKVIGTFVDLHPIDTTVSAQVPIIDPVTSDIITTQVKAIEQTLRGESF